MKKSICINITEDEVFYAEVHRDKVYVELNTSISKEKWDSLKKEVDVAFARLATDKPEQPVKRYVVRSNDGRFVLTAGGLGEGTAAEPYLFYTQHEAETERARYAKTAMHNVTLTVCPYDL